MAMISGDNILYYLLLLVCFIAARYYITRFLKPSGTLVLEPPSPPALPLIGHLHLLSSVLPKSFQALARRYGPLMRLRLGASACVIVSSAIVAKEVLKTQELNFSSRPDIGYSEHFLYRGSKFVLAQYGDYWRFMKKLCMTRILAVPQLEKFTNIRDQEKVKLVESVMKCCKEGRSCDLSSEITTMMSNIIYRMAMSSQRSDYVDRDAVEIKELTQTFSELSRKLCVGDVLGPLKIFDFSGTVKKFKAMTQKYDRFIERIISEHQDKAMKGMDENQRKDVLDILLEVYRDSTADMKISMNDIKSFLLDIFISGTDTSSTAMHWAMGELINHPKAFQKVRDEIMSVVGRDRLVNESDVPNLPYLRAVIKETLRLHPPGPLIPRECTQDCNVNGFIMRAKTRVIVNVYAIMRDPDSWTNPNEFDPDRFLENSEEKIGEHQMELKGQNFHYLPFGSGRRGCPGASLALLVMPAAVGSLVQCFDWKGKDGEKVDLTEGSGFLAEMAHPLVCNPIAHLNTF